MAQGAEAHRRDEAMSPNSHRTPEQIFADAMDMELSRQAERAYAKRADPHWKSVALRIDQARTMVRQRMSEEDRKATA